MAVVDNTYGYPSENGSIYSKIVQIEFNSVGDGKGWFKVSDAVNPDTALVSAFNIPVVDISGDEEAMLDPLALLDVYHPDMPDGALEGVTTDMYRAGLVSDPLASYISISSPLSVSAMWEEETYQSMIDSMSPYADVPEVGGIQTLGWDDSLTAVFQGWDTSVVSDMNAASQKSDFTSDHVEKDDRTGLTVVYHDVLFYAKWITVDGKPIEYAPSLNGTLFDYNLENGVLTFPEDGSTWNELKVVIEGEGAAVIGDNYGLSGQYMLLSPSDFNMDDPDFNQDGEFTGPFYIRQTDSDKAVISASIADPDAWSYSLKPADAGAIEYDEANNCLLVSLDKPATLRINGGTMQEITNEDGASVSFVTSDENAANWEGVDLVTEWMGGDIAQAAGEAVANFAAQSQIAIDKMYVYDIHLEKGGVEVQPAELGSSFVRVTIPVPEGVDPSLVQVFHVADDGGVTNMSAAPVPAELGNAVYFYTDSFSTYVLAVVGEDGSASVVPNETVAMGGKDALKGDLPQTGEVAFMTVLGTTAVAGASFAAAAISRRREH